MEKLIEDIGELYRTLVDTAADAVVVTDNEGTILHFSDSAESLFGYSPDDVLGKRLTAFIPDALSSHFIQGASKLQDVDAIHCDGTVIPVQLAIGRTKINDKKYFMIICHDHTNMRRTISEKLEIESINHALFDAAVDGIVTIDSKGIIRTFNQAAENLFGYSREEILGKTINTLMPAPHADKHDSYLRNYLATGKRKIIGIGRDVPGMRKDGSIFPMRLSVGQADSESGPLYIGLCHDLTEYQDAMIKLAQAERRYKSIVDSQGQIICRLDKNLRITFANKAFQSSFYCNEREVIGLNFVNYIHDEQHVCETLLSSLLTETEHSEAHLKVTMQRKKGTFTVEWWFRRVFDADLDSVEIQAFGIDVSVREEALREAMYLRTHDSLTGLLNQEALLDQFSEWRQTDQRYALMIIDCNHFHLINHKYGFSAANRMLITVSLRIARFLRQEHLAARARADQFLVMVPVNDTDGAFHLSSNLLATLEQAYSIDTDKIMPSARIGVAMYPDDGDDLSQLVRLAETALDEARTNSPRISFINNDLQHELHRQLEIEQGLKHALKRKEIKVFLQAKMTLQDDRISGFEALARWQDNKLGFVPPNEFIAVAETMNMATELDRYIIESTISQMGEFQKQGVILKPIAINITSKFFVEPGLADFIFNCASEAGIAVNLVELEITERMLMFINDDVLGNMQRLRQAGIKLAIDDFGTGYSSLSYLKNMNVDEIKIDKSFVDDIDETHGQALISAILSIAKAGDLKVVAEGVETALQRDMLRNMGCDYAQGYYYARPVPFAEALEILKA